MDTRTATFKVEAGETVTCTFTNKHKPQLRVAKFLIPSSDEGLVDLFIDSTKFDNNGNGFPYGGITDTGFQELSIGEYTVSEAPHEGSTNLEDYATVINCSNGAAGSGTSLKVSLDWGDKVTCMIANVKGGTIEVTDTSFCPLTGPFNLLYIQDGASTYRLTASNPGQFYDNVFFDNGNTASPVTLTIEVPYPFVTQGAVPIQVHSNVGINPQCPTSFVPVGDITSLFNITVTKANEDFSTNDSPSGAPIIVLGDYNSSPKMSSYVTVTVASNVPISGLIYVTIHLDYGLKPTKDEITGVRNSTDWTKGTDNEAIGYSPTPIVQGVAILGSNSNPQHYTFGFDVDSSGRFSLFMDDIHVMKKRWETLLKRQLYIPF